MHLNIAGSTFFLRFFRKIFVRRINANPKKNELIISVPLPSGQSYNNLCTFISPSPMMFLEKAPSYLIHIRYTMSYLYSVSISIILLKVNCIMTQTFRIQNLQKTLHWTTPQSRSPWGSDWMMGGEQVDTPLHVVRLVEGRRRNRANVTWTLNRDWSGEGFL